jgi:hypothetical protein
MADIGYLLNDIQFAEEVKLLFFILNCIKFILVIAIDILYMPQPGVNESVGLFPQRRLDTSAAIMSADNDMFDLEDFNRKLDNG